MAAIDIKRWFSDLLEHLQSNRQRQLVVLRGSRSWCDRQLDALYQTDPGLVLISNRHPHRQAVPLASADGLLGGEARLVMLDLYAGLDADVVCIAAGLVRAGGVLLLLAPPLDDWDLARDVFACWQDRVHSKRAWFVEYFFDALARDAQVGLVLNQDGPLPELPAMERLEPTPFVDGQTAEQAEQCRSIEAWLGSTRSGVALLSAARGRGKSTCLGQLADRLGKRGYRILVTASSRRAAAQLLEWAPQVEFVAPDALIAEPRPIDVLVVDEAAKIPQSMLRLLRRFYSRILMASTLGGYEGTGQGFRLRFLAELSADDCLCLELRDPVRWCAGDRLEAWLDRSLMLDAREPGLDSAATGEVRLEWIDTPGDPENRFLIRGVYALLAAAHYRTRPSDLRMLMENPDLKLLVARTGDRVTGAALLNPEGGFDASLCEQVFLGNRRPRGHLLAQMLTAQAGIRYFARDRGLRIQRIAVAREMRRQGLGRRLLDHALAYAKAHEYAYLGASFALDWANAQFWRHSGFALVHVSYAQGKSSGRHSIAVLKPASDSISETIEMLRTRVQRQLPVWMTQFLQFMEAGQAATLLRYAGYRFAADRVERADIEAFGQGNKGFELCFASLQPYVMDCIARSEGSPDPLLIEKAVQNRSWDQLDRSSGSEGRRQLQQRLRGLVAALDKAC